ncbi:MAG TPA: LytTR family DNA-binding domain-containing protein [Chitinophagaceae bacterium]|nr:LytTR family DNA-binding domain-containing protein [Chitinophagaceae bacterium]
MNLKAIIIDDEKSARQTLLKLINKYTLDVEVIAEAASISAGIDVIQKNKTDVVFLDIKMSSGSGFDILEQIEKIDFEIIFTTAYDRYALKAIKFSALDYLLKPINPDELNAAIEKVKKRKANSPETYFQNLDNFNQQIKNPGKQLQKITLSTSNGLIMVDLKAIIRCEGYKNYTTFYLTNQQRIVVSKTLKEYDNLLSSCGFIRIFQSHLINLSFIKRYIKGSKAQVEMADGAILPVSREKKNELLKILR